MYLHQKSRNNNLKRPELVNFSSERCVGERKVCQSFISRPLHVPGALTDYSAILKFTRHQFIFRVPQEYTRKAVIVHYFRPQPLIRKSAVSIIICIYETKYHLLCYEGKYPDENYLPESSTQCFRSCEKLAKPQLASVVCFGQIPLILRGYSSHKRYNHMICS